MVTNATIEALLGRRSIRKFKDEAIDDDTRATLETVAQHAASSQFLNDWSLTRPLTNSISSTAIASPKLRTTQCWPCTPWRPPPIRWDWAA